MKILALICRILLGLMFVVVLIFMPIVIGYTGWVYRVLRGRVTLEHIRSSHEGSY